MKAKIPYNKNISKRLFFISNFSEDTSCLDPLTSKLVVSLQMEDAKLLRTSCSSVFIFLLFNLEILVLIQTMLMLVQIIITWPIIMKFLLKKSQSDGLGLKFRFDFRIKQLHKPLNQQTLQHYGNNCCWIKCHFKQ